MHHAYPNVRLRFPELGFFSLNLSAIGDISVDADEPPRAQTLLDLSGLAWIEGDLFLGVHNAKNNPESTIGRVSTLFACPKSELEGVIWRPVELEFPGPKGRASDLESACSNPGRKGFLLCESGQEGKKDQRIFHAVYDDGKLKIDSYITWPVPISNVEATEVYEVGDQLLFLYAERADSQPATKVRWAPLSVHPIKIGEFREVTDKGVDPVGKGARPIVGMDVDDRGWIYTVSAYDPGSDDGPYRSVVWRIGKVTAGKLGRPEVRLGDAKRIATLDGLKVESVCVRKTEDNQTQVFVGTDDEHYGGILRPLP